jgi:hypothetical protein
MTAPLDLQSAKSRALHADEWVKKDPCNSDGFRPLSVRYHFDHDVPALIAEVERYRDTLEDLAKDCEAFPEDHTWAAIMTATAVRLRLILAGERP